MVPMYIPGHDTLVVGVGHQVIINYHSLLTYTARRESHQLFNDRMIESYSSFDVNWVSGVSMYNCADYSVDVWKKYSQEIISYCIKNSG